MPGGLYVGRGLHGFSPVYMFLVSRTGFSSGKILFEVWFGFFQFIHPIITVHFRITFMHLLLQESTFSWCMVNIMLLLQLSTQRSKLSNVNLDGQQYPHLCVKLNMCSCTNKQNKLTQQGRRESTKQIRALH